MRRQQNQNHPKTWQAALAVSTLVFGLTACSGGGHSSPPPPPPPGNAVPAISSLSPDHVTAGGSGFTLTVNGSNFISSSVVNWNDSPRITSFVNSGQLTASISQGDIAAVGTAQVSVFNPPPDGGSSGNLMFSISGAAPSITSLSPPSRAAGGPSFTLTVNGTNFNSSTVVRWNGGARATTFLNGGQVTASIPSTDTAAAGIAQVTVFNPGPDGGASAARNLPIFLGLSAADLIYDAVNSPNNRIYASVPAGAPPGSGTANTITAIDPVAGIVLQTPAPVSVANDPGPLAISDDGQFLYLGLNQAPSVRRLILSDTPALDPLIISLGGDASLRAESLQVIQGTQGASFAVARKFLNRTPRNAGVAVFDGAFQRSTTTDAGSSPNVIQLCSSPSVLFGLNVADGSPGFYLLRVDSSGVVLVDRTSSLSGSDISFAATSSGERIFSTSGQVLNVADLSIVNAFPVTGLVKADATVGRVFFLTQNPAPSTTTWTLRAFDIETFAPRGNMDIPGVNGNPSSLIRWGTNGLAFRTDSGQVFLITSALVAGP